MVRRLVIALFLAPALGVGISPPAVGQSSPVQPYRTGDRSVTALNILPPGQGRYVNTAEFLQFQGGGEPPAQNTDQHEMYDSLVQGVSGLSGSNLTDYFKDASFGVPEGEVERAYSPRPGVDILRDRAFGVPHIYGATRSDTLFGAGYATAEDRLFMIDVLRHVGRGRLSEFLGPSDANLAMDCGTYLSADYTEQELETMLNRVPPGADAALAEQARQDVRDYAAGINAHIDEALLDPSKLPTEYPALQQVPEPWRATDTVAVAALIGANFGVGGGQELRNAAFLDALEDEGHTPQQARAIFDDFRFADDPEAPTSADGTFPLEHGSGTDGPRLLGPPGSRLRADAEPVDPLSGGDRALRPGLGGRAVRPDPSGRPRAGQ